MSIAEHGAGRRGTVRAEGVNRVELLAAVVAGRRVLAERMAAALRHQAPSIRRLTAPSRIRT